jgi:hypothetical protein
VVEVAGRSARRAGAGVGERDRGTGERERQTKTRASGSGGAIRRTGRGRRETGDGQRTGDVDGKETTTTAREIGDAGEIGSETARVARAKTYSSDTML